MEREGTLDERRLSNLGAQFQSQLFRKKELYTHYDASRILFNFVFNACKKQPSHCLLKIRLMWLHKV